MAKLSEDSPRGERRREWVKRVQVLDASLAEPAYCESLDLSENGLRMTSSVPFQQERFVTLIMGLPNMPGLYEIPGQIRWCEQREHDFLIGVIMDLQSASYSRVMTMGATGFMSGLMDKLFRRNRP
ncbi:MAG: PilZ domain-containing protein [Halothiobacillaceae bacterium]|nr:MAG: PilZ domain-containing protein [Halothiobacillaceae bacterium]